MELDLHFKNICLMIAIVKVFGSTFINTEHIREHI